MRKQRGFFVPSPATIMAATIVILTGLLWLQTHRMHSCQHDFAAYQGGVEALGRAAEIETAKKNLANLKAKERTDEEIKSGRTRNAVDSERVRSDIARGGFVPSTAPGACSPAGAPVNWPDVDAAIREFAAEVQGQVEKGTDAAGALDALKRKAQSGN